MALVVCPLKYHLMVFSLMQIVFDLFLREGKHVLDTQFEQVFQGDTLVHRVIELVLSYKFDNFSLILGHRFKHEGESYLLVVILKGKEW